MDIHIPESHDEVTFSDYRQACERLEHCAQALRQVTPDEAAEFWLPTLTQQVAIIFNFVGSNMTARHVPKLVVTQAALDRAKDGPDGVVESRGG